MENNELPDLPEAEKAEFQQRYQKQPLPVDLEDKVVAALREKKLFGWRVFQQHPLLKPFATVMLAGLLFFLGLWFGLRKEKPPVVDIGNQYLLLLFNPPGYDAGTSHAKEYGEWFRRLNDKAATGEELKEKAWRISLVNNKPVVENEFSDAGRPTGFFIIHAASEKDALATAADCPHVKYNGVVTVRPVQTNR